MSLSQSDISQWFCLHRVIFYTRFGRNEACGMSIDCFHTRGGSVRSHDVEVICVEGHTYYGICGFKKLWLRVNGKNNFWRRKPSKVTESNQPVALAVQSDTIVGDCGGVELSSPENDVGRDDIKVIPSSGAPPASPVKVEVDSVLKAASSQEFETYLGNLSSSDSAVNTVNRKSTENNQRRRLRNKSHHKTTMSPESTWRSSASGHETQSRGVEYKELLCIIETQGSLLRSQGAFIESLSSRLSTIERELVDIRSRSSISSSLRSQTIVRSSGSEYSSNDRTVGKKKRSRKRGAKSSEPASGTESGGSGTLAVANSGKKNGKTKDNKGVITPITSSPSSGIVGKNEKIGRSSSSSTSSCLPVTTTNNPVIQKPVNVKLTNCQVFTNLFQHGCFRQVYPRDSDLPEFISYIMSSLKEVGWVNNDKPATNKVLKKFRELLFDCKDFQQELSSKT